MLNKLERVRNVVELNKSGDINKQTALIIIDRITSHKKFESQMYPFPSNPKVPTKIILKGKMKYMRWTPRQEQLLKQLIDEHRNYKVIAKKMGRSYDAVRIRAKCLGFAKPRPYNHKKKRIKTAKRNLEQRKWTSSEEHKMIDMINRGYSTEEVAKECDRTKKAVELRMYRIRRKAKNGGMFNWRGKKNGKN